MSDWKRLAEKAKAERERQGLTQEEVAAKGGPSTASLRLIEGALQTSYRGRTLRQLEDALGWERGSVWTVLEGGEPHPANGTSDLARVKIVSDGVFFNTYVTVDGKPLAGVVALRFTVSDGLTCVSLDLENVALEFDGEMEKRTQETVTYVSKPDIASHEVTTTT